MAKYKTMQLADGMFYVTNSTGTKYWHRTGNVDKAVVEKKAATLNARHKFNEFVKAHNAATKAGAGVNYHEEIGQLCNDVVDNTIEWLGDNNPDFRPDDARAFLA